MPLLSSDVSNFVGGQMVMFSNQAQFAQQVGATAGFNAPPGGGMQSPHMPSYALSGYGQQGAFGQYYGAPGGVGGAAAAGLGMAMPAAVGGVSMMAGFGAFGHLGGYMDPFTGVGRAFAAGAGAGGQGLAGTMGHLGGAFAQGGLRGGLGALGGGLAAAALPAAGYYMAGQAISTVGENIAQGARNISQVGQTAQQYFGPSYGVGGVRPGGQLPRQEIQAITTALHELAGEDVMRTMESMKKLMSQAGAMGMLTGISDAASFKQRFSKVVKQVETVAKIMGSTLEEAMPMLGQLQGMGIWRASDIIGTTTAMQTVGRAAAPAMMGAMQQGSMQGYQMGGTLASGANLARNQFMLLNSAMQTGAMTEEQLREYTGGIGGAEGQQQLAARMTGTMQQMAYSPMMRLLTTALGEKQGETFTGRIDEKRMKQFMAGGLGTDSLQQMGMGRTGSREAAASWSIRNEKMGQELMSQGGMELVGQAITQVMNRAGYSDKSDAIKMHFIQKMMGVNQRDAQMWLDLSKDLPRMLDQKARRERDALEDQFRRLDERQNRSWEGLKSAISHRFEKAVEDPLQHLGERLSTSVNENVDDITNWVTGRTRNVEMTGRGRLQMLLGRNNQMTGLQALGLSPTFRDQLRAGSPIERFRMGESRAESLSAVGADITEMTNKELRNMGAGRVSVGWGTGRRADGGAQMLNRTATLEQLEQGAKRVFERAAGDPTLASLEFNHDPEAQHHMERVTSTLRDMLPTLGELEEKYKDDPQKYAAAVAEELRKRPGMEESMNALKSSKKGTRAMDDMDLVAIAQGKLASGGRGRVAHMVKFDAAAKKIEWARNLPTGEAANKRLLELTEQMTSSVNSNLLSPATAGYAGGVGGALVGAKAGALAGSLLGPVGTVAGAVIGAGAGYMAGKFGGTALSVSGEKISRTALQNALTDPDKGVELQEWLSGGMQGPPPSFPEGSPHAAVVDELYKKRGDPDFRQKTQAAAEEYGAILSGKLTDKMYKDRAGLASDELRSLKTTTGLSDPVRSKMQSMLEQFKAGSKEGTAAGNQMLRELAGMKLSDKERSVLESTGAYGEQIRQMRVVGELGDFKGGLTRDDAMKRLNQTGLPMSDLLALPGMQEKFDEMFLSGRGAKGLRKGGKEGELAISEEFKPFVEELKNIAEKLGATNTRQGAQSESERLMGLFQSASEANTRFVTAVGIAVPALQDKDFASKMDKALSSNTKPTNMSEAN